jgi:hypothetical protein
MKDDIMFKPLCLALALILSPAPLALAQEGGTPAADTPAVETPAPAPSTTLRAGDIAPDGTKVKCRSVKVIGTRFPKRECKSEAAWKKFDEYTNANAKRATDRLQRNGNAE